MATTQKGRPKFRKPGRLTSVETLALEASLLDAAEHVFVESGYGRASIEAIAKAAGVSRKTVYARYAGKDEVLSAVVNRLLDRAMAPHHEPDRFAATSAGPRALLLQIARELASLSAAPHVAGINRFVFAEAVHAPDLLRLFLNLHQRAVENVKQSLEMLRDAGSLPRLPDSQLAATIFIEMAASIPRIRALLGVPLENADSDEVTAAAVDIFLKGCGSP